MKTIFFACMFCAACASGWAAKNAVFAEVGGSALFYSVNYDRTFSDALSGRIGFSIIGESGADGGQNKTRLILPVFLNYRVGAGNHKLELGGGPVFPIPDRYISSHFAINTIIGLTGGYRYQTGVSGVFFRAALTPLFGFSRIGREDFRMSFLPWIGLSLGYSISSP